MENKVITCIHGNTVRDVVKQAQELKIPREDVVNMFTLNGQIYLVYYK